ncbi:EAL domain-containing protein [Pseudolysobacter antarcticus]|uniref:EAL domain-containing protein n=1 Tax=Pseudolysobacter antarcticus TaxID=2511995 RepID=A0A411HNE8_9GAMM|nr:EAL domain-containing protein [Pseudolysobacter antarcticus]QBB71992.1 EAL domain-containing protein [Pseudolysobacter antarcticus]
MSSYRKTLEKGAKAYRCGDMPLDAFLIVSGSVEISIRRDGVQIPVVTLSSGEMFGEMELIDGGMRRLTASAMTDCVLQIIKREQIVERLDNTDPIVRALLQRQLSRFRVALELIESDVIADTGHTDPSASVVTSAIAKLRLEAQLREALEQGVLEILWQPIGAIADGRIVGYEALMRWPHVDLGDLMPKQFIALAEETSLIVVLGDYALQRVCIALRALADCGCSPMPYIALNVSGRALSSAVFVDQIIASAVRHGIDTAWIRLEVTESVFLDYHQIEELIQRCHAVNIRVAVDDFGTEYSNFSHLHRLAFDTIKLEQNFTHDLDQPRCLAMVQAIIAVARAIDADIVAEGVETDAQLQQLRQLGCDYAQGFLIGKPLTSTELLASIS